MNEMALINSLIDFSIISHCNDKAQGCPPQAANWHNRNERKHFTNEFPPQLSKETTFTCTLSSTCTGRLLP